MSDHANFADFTLLFCRRLLRNAQGFKTHVLSYCVPLIRSFVLPPPRCRRLRGFYTTKMSSNRSSVIKTSSRPEALAIKKVMVEFSSTLIGWRGFLRPVTEPCDVKPKQLEVTFDTQSNTIRVDYQQIDITSKAYSFLIFGKTLPSVKDRDLK